MLKLKRVELQGFKSFCDRTELKFAGSGIAAVVGPNGCGKSNLSDAITWVLGEQSARSLRGARMEDVIFAGTRNRKAVGMASVTMVLVDPGAEHSTGAPDESFEEAGNVTAMPAKPSQVTITRRLFRSGESEYLIDGRQARLRDIQDIFMGSGLGPESYAIIEQGRIGQILSSKPSDRRSVIEEAAGITRYKSRKRLAEAKLESAKQNLSRVFDILEEVTRQANSLKRQAAKARRYTELKADLDARLRVLLGARFRQLDIEARDTTLSLEEASAALKEVSEQVAHSDAERERLQGICYQLERDLTAQRKLLSEVHIESERTRGRLEAQVRESGSLEQLMQRGEEENRGLEQRISAGEAERGTLAAGVTELEAAIARSRALLIDKNQVRERLQDQLREHDQTIESNRFAALRLLGEAATLKNQLAQIDEFLAGIDRESVRVQVEEKSVQAELERLAGARHDLSASLLQRQMDLESVTKDKRQTEVTLSAKRALAAQSRSQLDQMRGECSRLRARKESLENVISHHSYTTDSVKRLLHAAERGNLPGGNSPNFEPLGVLADFVEVDATYERAVEEFLRDELEYVVVRNWEQAERGMQIFHPATGEPLEGRATFLVEEGAESISASARPAPGLPRLIHHLRLTNGLHHQTATLLPRLSHCYLAPDEQTAREMSAQYPELHFLLPAGQCYYGRMLTGGHKKASGPLALKRELRELSKLLAEQDRLLGESTAAFERLSEETIALDRDLDRLRSLEQSGEKDALALGHEMRKVTEETNRANSRISVARLDLERLNRERTRSLEQRDKNRAAVGEKDQERSAREQLLEAARQELDAAQAEAGRVREEHSTLRAELAALEERHRSASNALGRLDAQIRDTRERRNALARDVERMGEQRARLLTDNIELDATVAKLAERLQTVDAGALLLAEQERARRLELQGVEDALKNLRLQTEAGHVRRGELEVELVRRQSEIKFLDETSRKELGSALADLAPISEDTESDLAEVERGYNEVRGKIESLGPINPQALEEFEEAQTRQDFLTAQRQDLLDSIRDTEKAIHEIDGISRQRFQEAFHAINEQFRLAFQTLFGGGSGEMRLTDETNAAESGIDIIASPPGKKLQNVLLLSGGEKSLAAMALLMAIFKFQPSPFCVLDEVDAPLDEANIGRLTKLLKEMSLDTQFIVITHSKKTMEAAQSMYGVTMQEAGISKLVSVRLGVAEAAHPAVA